MQDNTKKILTKIRKKGKKMANKINHRSSQVLMKTPTGYEHMFESITAAAKFAKANNWTMAMKMQAKGYFEDAQGNKYYRKDEMNTKNKYTTASAKMVKKVKPNQKRKTKTNKMPEQIDIEPKVSIKDENISVIIDSTDPAIKAINDRIVELLKQSSVYEEIKKLSQAIQKLSK